MDNPPEVQTRDLAEPSLGRAGDRVHETKTHIRESREKKDSFKKRESAVNKKGSTANVNMKDARSSAPLPIRYNLPQPRLLDFEGPRDPVFTSHEPMPFLTPDRKIELKKPTDQ